MTGIREEGRILYRTYSMERHKMGALLKLGKWSECDNYMQDGGIFYFGERLTNALQNKKEQ
jgi:hypothetical protein